MEITTSQANGRVPITILHLKGDLMDEEPLHSTAAQAIANGSQYILLDMNDVPYVSSAGLRAIQFVFQSLQEGNHEDNEAMKRGIIAGSYKSPHLKLLNPSKNAAKALGVAGYDMFLEVHHNMGTAVNSF